MSLNYSLEMDTEFEPNQAMHTLADELGLNRSERGGLVSLRTSGLFIIASKADKSYYQQVFEETYGVRAKLSVSFELYPSEEGYEEAMRIMIRAAMVLLHHEPGDAVMIFNGEDVLLQRIGGKLVLNESWSNWTAYRQLLLELVLPYELRHLRSPAMEEHTPTVA